MFCYIQCAVAFVLPNMCFDYMLWFLMYSKVLGHCVCITCFSGKCNRICVDKRSNFSFSEIKVWAGTYLNPSRAQLAQERRNMCRSREITLRARANESNISQAFVSLPASFYQETSSTREFHETSKPHGICNHNNLLSSWICVRLVLLLSTCWPIR